jgi:acyl-CoA thioester hydrolase
MQTRWKDNDMFGHMNNTVYYSLMDSAIAHFLLMKAGLNLHPSPLSPPPTSLPFVVHSTCDFISSIAYPAVAHVGVSVVRLGSTSVTYQCAVFNGDEIERKGAAVVGAAAVGKFVHCWVDPIKQRPVEMSPDLRAAYMSIERAS